MHAVHVVARVLLGAVFVAAGASKVASGKSWPAQALQLGVPAAVATVVPWCELTMGALVVVGVATPWPVVVAMAMLAVFTAMLIRTLLRGERPPCACFGSWSASPLGWSHVARNAGFMALGVASLLTS